MKRMIGKVASLTGAFLLAGAAWAADSEWEYTSVAGGVSITKYTGSSRNVTVPSTILVGEEQKAVVAIAAETFKDKTGIKGITIPGSVKSIGDSAFYNCADLRTLNLSEGLATIGAYAFYSTDLVNLSVPSSVTNVGRYAFLECSSLETAEFKGPITGFASESLNVHDHGDGTWANRGQLGRVFKNCTALTDVTFAEGQTFVGRDMFENCTALVRVTLPSSVATIHEYAFNGCSYLKSLALPSGLRQIHNHAFYNCVRLESATIPAATGYIGVSAYENDTQLGTVVFNAGVTNIFQSAFRNCGVTAVTLPASLKEIGSYAFFDCDSLKTVEFKGIVTGFSSEDANVHDHGDGDWANRGRLGRVFKNCNTLESVKFADGQKFIGRDMFESCTKLADVDLPDSVEEIWEYAFNGCTALQEIVLPESLWTIDDYAFSGCTELVAIEFPEALEEIHVGAFENDTKLVSVAFASDGWLEKIYQSAFRHCGVTSLDIPSSVDRLGGYAFFDCSSLTNVTFRGKVRGFEDEDSNVHDHGDGDWANRGQLGRVFKSCDALESVAFANGQKFVGRDMFEGCTSLTDVKFADTIEEVYGYAFNGCSSLPNIVLPDSLWLINDYAFCNCTALAGVDFPATVEEIHVGAFENDVALAAVTFESESKLKRIYQSAFRHSGVTAVSFPNSLLRLGGYAFFDCDALESISFSSPVSGFDEEDSNIHDHGDGDWANRGQLGRVFKSCGALEVVTFAAGQEFIGRDMFEKCVSLVSVDLPALASPHKQTIHEYAFCGCTALRSFDAKTELSRLGDCAFNGCTALHYVTFAGLAAPLVVGENVFGNTKEKMTVYADPAGTGWTGVTTETGFPASGTWQGRTIADVATKSSLIDNPFDFTPFSPTFYVSGNRTWKAPIVVTASPYLVKSTRPDQLGTDIYLDDPVYLSFAWDEYWRGENAENLTNRFTLASGETELAKWNSDGLSFDKTSTNGGWVTNDVQAALQNLPIGEYTLSMEVNGPQNLAETDYSNNATSITFRIVNRPDVKVTLNRNGGSGGSNSVMVAYRKAMPTITVPTKKNYIFAGYWTTASGEGVKYYNADGTGARASDLKAATTLYARWELPTYAIRFIKNDGAGTLTNVTFSHGVSVKLPTLSALGWVRNGMTFKGWTKSGVGAFGGTAQYLDGAAVTSLAAAGATVDLIAVWELKSDYYAIKYFKNDGTGKWRSAAYKYGVKTTLPSCGVGLGWTRTGYTFKGWSFSANGTIWKGDRGVVQTGIPKGTVRNLYAIWEKAQSYSIRFVKNDGAGTLTTRTFTYGVSTKLPTLSALGWVRNGMTFKGWTKSGVGAFGGTAQYLDGAAVTSLAAAGATVDLIAVWELKSGFYGLKYYKNDGTGKWRSAAYKYGVKTTLPSCGVGLGWTRTGYAFKGWSLTATGTTAWKPDRGVIVTGVPAGKVFNLYAIWQKTAASFAAAPRTEVLAAGLVSDSADADGFLSGTVVGAEAGSFNLLVDEDGATGYVRLVLDGEIVSGECEILLVDGNRIVIALDEVNYTLEAY